MLDSFYSRLPRFLGAQGADVNPGIAKVRRHLDAGDRRESGPWVLQVGDGLSSYFSDLLRHTFGSGKLLRHLLVSPPLYLPGRLRAGTGSARTARAHEASFLHETTNSKHSYRRA